MREREERWFWLIWVVSLALSAIFVLVMIWALISLVSWAVTK